MVDFEIFPKKNVFLAKTLLTIRQGAQNDIFRKDAIKKTFKMSPLSDRQRHLPHSNYFECRTKSIKATPSIVDLTSIITS